MKGHKFWDGADVSVSWKPSLYLHLDNRRPSVVEFVVDFDPAAPSLLVEDFESPFVEPAAAAVQNSRWFQAAKNAFQLDTDSSFKIVGTNDKATEKYLMRNLITAVVQSIVKENYPQKNNKISNFYQHLKKNFACGTKINILVEN